MPFAQPTFFATADLFSIIRQQWLQESKYSGIVMTLFYEWKNTYTDFFMQKIFRDYVFETDLRMMEKDMILRFPVLSLALH